MQRAISGALLGLLLASAPAAAMTADSCAAAKLRASARAVRATLRCAARVVRTNPSAVDRCSAAGIAHLTRAFTGADARGACAATGNDAAAIAAIGRLRDGLRDVLDPPGGVRCLSAKLRAVAGLSFAVLTCPGRANDGYCLVGGLTRFQAAMAAAERLECGTTGDAAPLGAAVERFRRDVESIVATGAPPPGPPPTGLHAEVAGAQVALTWMGESGPTDVVRVVRRLNTPPDGPDDPMATAVFTGAAAMATDDLRALLPDTPTVARTYHYAAFTCAVGGACETTGSRTTLTPTVTQTLRAGGYVVYWRHATASVCVDRTDLGTAATTAYPEWWKRCDATCPAVGTVTATARQLSATGTTEATTIGTAIAARSIPFGRVLASEFCRAVTTAQLLNLGPSIEQSQGITFFVYDEANRCAATTALVTTPPSTANTAVVGHGVACPIIPGDLAMSEAVILKPDGQGSATFITRVTSGAWSTLP